MKYWAGETPNNSLKLKHNYVMDSVINYYHLEDPEIEYEYNKLFLDNGAFSALKNSQKSILEEERVLNVQEKLKPEYTVPLDYPFTPGMDKVVMQKRWNKTAENIEYWIDVTDLNLVPALHAWDRTSLQDNIRLLYRKDQDYISMGSILTTADEFNGFFGDRQPSKNLIDSIITTKQICDQYDLDIHIFGFGSSPIMYHIGAFIGIKSTDSIGYKRKAAYGKIILPQTGERYCGNGEAKFGNLRKKGGVASSYLTEDELQKLSQCKCPVCREQPADGSLRWENLRDDWVKRAYHNKWVMEHEEDLSRIYNDDKESYLKFLDETIGKSGLGHLWEYTKRRLTHYKIDLLY
ncbi:hypothetical protein [Methanothermobacter sp. EMTCatA1]|jgi:queuine/archaeosine tRNA-ribosyltransferase|uniref:hypothetical protein n=1 Tax=Methanothermobacter sp. EMTCatA1 TaxID=2017966 RepID=UPI000B5E4A41|nr:hypothetical protein [Methanothermobacter sp. EMTCatA1]BAZ98542.1 hypothetical protein tca_00467 [Methanothermobacter sp. EMTCatA1]